jgi:hypothetical protein
MPAHMSCRPMIALMSGALETCACTLGTCVPSWTSRIFFMLETRSPQGVTRHLTASEPTLTERRGLRSHRTRGSAGAHISREARSGAIGHVAAPEPTSAWSSEARGSAKAHLSREAMSRAYDSWQRRSPSQQGDEVRSYRACGRVWMHTLLLILTWSLYVGVPDLKGTDSFIYIVVYDIYKKSKRLFGSHMDWKTTQKSVDFHENWRNWFGFTSFRKPGRSNLKFSKIWKKWNKKILDSLVNYMVLTLKIDYIRNRIMKQ